MKDQRIASPNIQAVPDESERPVGHDIFQDPALAQTVTEDPLFKFLNKYWQQVLLVVGAVVASFYAYHVFQASHHSEMEKLSELLNRVRTEMSQLQDSRGKLAAAQSEATANKENTELKTKIEDLEKNTLEAERRLDGLISSLTDARQPYATLGLFYKGLTAIQAGKVDSGLKILEDLKANLKSSDPESRDIFYADLAGFVKARTQLDNDASRKEAWTELTAIAQGKGLLNTAAALTLAHGAKDDSERAAARVILEQMRTEYPEQNELLQPLL